MQEQNSNEKTTPFLKRVAQLEKEVKEIKQQLEIVLKVLSNKR